MSATLSEELRKKHGIRSLPVRKDDEVEIFVGTNKGVKGKVTQVYRKRWCLYIEKLSKTKANGNRPSLILLRSHLQNPDPPKQR